MLKNKKLYFSVKQHCYLFPTTCTGCFIPNVTFLTESAQVSVVIYGQSPPTVVLYPIFFTGKDYSRTHVIQCHSSKRKILVFLTRQTPRVYTALSGWTRLGLVGFNVLLHLPSDKTFFSYTDSLVSTRFSDVQKQCPSSFFFNTRFNNNNTVVRKVAHLSLVFDFRKAIADSRGEMIFDFPLPLFPFAIFQV